MSSNLEKFCDLRGNNKKISIYLIESESRENYSDFQVRIYGDGEINQDINFKYQNFSTKNTESAYAKANKYFNEQKEYYLSLGFKEKVGLLDKVKQKLQIK